MTSNPYSYCVAGCRTKPLTDQEVGSVEVGSGTLALLVSGGLCEFVLLPIWLIEKSFRPPVVTAA